MGNKSDWFENKTVIDISPVISEDIGVFPGDERFSRKVSMSTQAGDHLTLSSISTTLHVGAHTDGPNHYGKTNESIEAVGLSPYMGRCQVVQVQVPAGERIRCEHVSHVNWSAPRVLFKTGSFPDPKQWNSDFNALSPELIESLVEKGVQLVGIDTPSVDLESDKELLSHTAIFKNNLRILEGVVLNHVSPGVYYLLALPLPIKGGDASPVRAVLLQENLQC